MINYEKESLYHRVESQYMFEELAKENDNLKRLLLINHEFTEQIGALIVEKEKEEQEKQLKKYKDLQDLQAKAQERLNKIQMDVRAEDPDEDGSATKLD